MAAARYWRVVGIEAYGSGDLELSELHLYGASARLDAAATLTCSHSPIAGVLANLKDDSTTTSCRFAAADVWAAGFALVWDFGAGNAADVTGLRLGAADVRSRYLSACSLQSSADGVAWGAAQTMGRFPWPGARSLGSPSSSGDANYANVRLLLAGDAYTDRSSAPHSVTNVGVEIRSDRPLFDGPAYYFNGAGARLEVSTPSDFAFGTDDFTFGWWSWRSATKEDALVFSTSIDASANGGYWIDFAHNNLTMYGPGSGLIILASNVGTYDAAWTYWEITRAGTVVRAFKNGALVAERTAAVTSLIATNVRVGGTETFGGYNSWYNGYLAHIRADRGVARHTANFTPPSAPFPASAGVFTFDELPISAGGGGRGLIAASADIPSQSMMSVGVQMTRDVEVGGGGTIYGTTKTKGAPNLPSKARVVLLHQRSKLPVRETWSDPVTGFFEFRGIDTNQQFLTLAEDVDGNFRPVAANRLTPEVLA